MHNEQMTIVIVDTPSKCTQNLINILTKQSYQVCTVISNKLALLNAQSTPPPDLILLDIRKSDANSNIDGYKVCKQLKANEQTHHIPVIFMSDLNNTLNKVNAFSVGGIDYITRPFQMDEVIARIEAHLLLQKQLKAQNKQLQQKISKHIQAEKVIGDIISGVSPAPGKQFFDSMVIQLAKTLEADYTFIGELAGGNHETVKIIAICDNGVITDNFDYALAHTPCKNVIEKNVCSYPIGASQLFPQDDLLQEMNIEGYIGVPLFNSKNQPLGIIVTLYHNPIHDTKFIESIIRIFAAQIAIEIEHTRAKEALQRSEIKLRAITENSPDSILLLDREGTIQFINRTLSGLDKTDVIGKPFYNYISARHVATARACVERVLQTGKTDKIITDRIQANGLIKWFESRVSPVIQHNQIVGITIATTDITESREAKKALAKKHNLLQTILDSAIDFIYVKDTEGRFLMINPAHVRSLGKSSVQDVIGKTNTEVYSPEVAAQFGADEKRIIQTGHPMIDKDEMRLNQAGEPIWLRTTKVPLRNNEGTIIGIVGITRDITEGKHANEQLRKLSQAVEQSANVIVITDLDYTIEFVNPAFAKTTGYTYQEVIGQSIDILQPKNGSSQIYEDLSATITKGKVWRGELLYKKKEGELYWNLVTVSPIKDKDNTITHYVAIQENISDRKQAEVELQQAKETAETANQAKSTFLANMSHELRTPLNGILGYAQILKQDTSLVEKQKRQVDIIQRSGNHLLMMINDILDISKIEAEKMDLVPIEFKFPQFLETISEIIQAEARHKGLQFTYKHSLILPTIIYSDETRLRQILLNLLSNAIKFTAKGSVIFRVTVFADDPNVEQPSSTKKIITTDNKKHQIIRFEIEDTGVGIASENLDKIFWPFQRGNAWYNQVEGTGLGLAISQRLVEIMGGTLNVKSVLDQGSLFWFDLKLVTFDESKITINEINTPTVIGLKGPKLKILIVDDKPVNRTVLVNLLAPLGFQIVEASNGQEALNKLEFFQPDVIFMDLIMPIMDGFETTRQIRQLSHLKKVIIVALSAQAFEQDRQKSLAAGCDGFVTKPFVFNHLLQQMKSLLDPTLKWIYKYPSEQTQQHNKTNTLPKLPPEHHAILLEATQKGDIKRIRSQISKLEQLSEDYKPLTTHLKQLAKLYQLTKIKAFLEKSQTTL